MSPTPTPRNPRPVTTAVEARNACDNIMTNPDGTPRGARAEVWIKGSKPGTVDIRAGGLDAGAQPDGLRISIHDQNPGRAVCLGRYSTPTAEAAKEAATLAARRIVRIYGLVGHG